MNKEYIECPPTTIVYGTEPLGPELISKLEALEGIPFDAFWDENKKALMINKGEFINSKHPQSEPNDSTPHI